MEKIRIREVEIRACGILDGIARYNRIIRLAKDDFILACQCKGTRLVEEPKIEKKLIEIAATPHLYSVAERIIGLYEIGEFYSMATILENEFGKLSSSLLRYFKKQTYHFTDSKENIILKVIENTPSEIKYAIFDKLVEYDYSLPKKVYELALEAATFENAKKILTNVNSRNYTFRSSVYVAAICKSKNEKDAKFLLDKAFKIIPLSNPDKYYLIYEYTKRTKSKKSIYKLFTYLQRGLNRYEIKNDFDVFHIVAKIGCILIKFSNTFSEAISIVGLLKDCGASKSSILWLEVIFENFKKEFVFQSANILLYQDFGKAKILEDYSIFLSSDTNEKKAYENTINFVLSKAKTSQEKNIFYDSLHWNLSMNDKFLRNIFSSVEFQIIIQELVDLFYKCENVDEADIFINRLRSLLNSKEISKVIFGIDPQKLIDLLNNSENVDKCHSFIVTVSSPMKQHEASTFISSIKKRYSKFSKKRLKKSQISNAIIGIGLHEKVHNTHSTNRLKPFE